MSNTIQGSSGHSVYPTQDSDTNLYANRFAAVANKLVQMQPAELQTTLKGIADSNPALADSLKRYLKLAPAAQQAELAKMRAGPATSSVPEMVGRLELLSPVKQSSALRALAQQDAKMAATLRQLLSLPAAERQKALVALQAGSVAAAQTSPQTSSAAQQARAKAESMIAQTRNTLMDALTSPGLGGNGQQSNGAEGLFGLSQFSTPAAQPQNSAHSAYLNSVGAKGR
ncbi:MAG: hypothetical protein H7338_06860 [Candidatus Sericytochromatia bacterium]|nr:hypothetical protein [Candidatus Sericytochromatia bacterium]